MELKGDPELSGSPFCVSWR